MILSLLIGSNKANNQQVLSDIEQQKKAFIDQFENQEKYQIIYNEADEASLFEKLKNAAYLYANDW